MIRVKRIIIPLLCVFMVFVMSISAAAVVPDVDLGVTGSRSLSDQEVYEYFAGASDLDVDFIKAHYSCTSDGNNVYRLTYETDSGEPYYYLIWVDDGGTYQHAMVTSDGLEYRTDEENQDTSEADNPGSSSDGSIAEKGFSDASAFLSVVGEIATFIVNNELCLISLTFVFIVRGIRLLRKCLRVTPR